VIPSGRLLGLLVLAAVVLAVGVVFPAFTTVGLAIDALIIALCLVDWWVSPRPEVLEPVREAGPILSLGVENPVVLRLQNRGPVEVRVQARESLADTFIPQRVTLAFAIGPGGEGMAPYSVWPTRRGEYPFAPLSVRLLSRLGLFWRQRTMALEGSVRVYPDVSALRQLELATRRNRMAEIGLRRVRWIGSGTEFESLREYGPDDDFRQIDWKATARLGRAVARQHQIERSQPILLVVDAGRLMTPEFEGLSRLDHAINTALLLAYVALGRGDRVGLLTFGERLHRFIPPLAGPAVLPSLMEGLFDLKPTLKEADYSGAFEALAARQQKRALIVVFSEVSSLEASDELVCHLSILAPRHLPLVVCVRDVELYSRVERHAHGERGVLEKVAALSLIEERSAALTHLEKRGVLVVDVRPGDLNLAVVDRYLELKGRGRL